MYDTYHISENSFRPWIVSSLLCTVTKGWRYIRPNSKKNSFCGNYSQKYDRSKIFAATAISKLSTFSFPSSTRQCNEPIEYSAASKLTYIMYFIIPCLWINPALNYYPHFYEEKLEFFCNFDGHSTRCVELTTAYLDRNK